MLFPVWAMLWMGCSSNQSSEVLFNTSPVPAESRPPTESMVRIHKQFGETKTFSDVLAIDKIVKLQVTESSILANISDLAIIENHMLVLDGKQSQLFMFDSEGGFLKQVGRLGQGPGEYIKPAYITADKDRFLLLDTDLRRLIFYDRNGAWIRSDNLSDSGIFPVGDFLYHHKRIYFPSPIYTRSTDPTLPENLIYDTVQKRVLWGFEKRFPLFYKKRPPFKIHYTSFSRVGDRIWFGPPYISEVFIYDLDGRFLRKLSPGISDALSQEDYNSASNRGEFKKVWRSKLANSAIFHLPPYVLVTFSGKISRFERMSVFDADGNILAKNFQVKNTVLFPTLLGAHGNHLIGVVDIDFYLKSAIDAYLTPQQKAMFVAAGWDETGHGDSEDNAYLVFFKVTL